MDIQIKVPTHIDDITVEQYSAYAKISKDGADEDFKIIKTVSIFTEIDPKTVSLFTNHVAIDIYNEIQDVLSMDTQFKDRFELDGVQYGFIPNIEEMTLGEYVDLEENLKDAKDLHKAAAVLFRPITGQYKDLYEIESYRGGIKAAEVMKKAPLGIVSNAVVFFYLLGIELLRDSLASLRRKERTLVGKDNSLAATVGLIQSMLYPEETSIASRRPHDKISLQHFYTLNTQKEKVKSNKVNTEKNESTI